MGIFASIFGSAKNTETIVNGAVSGIDKMFYTKEEKAENAGRAAEWFLKYLEATNPQNLARRLIAMVIVGLWALLILIGIAAKGIETYFFVVPIEGQVLFSTFIFNVLTDIVMYPFLTVIGFYFAAHVLRQWTGVKEKQ